MADDVYDNDNKPQGLGTTPSGPDFAAPDKTYNADPETAAAETADQNQASASEPDKATGQEQAAASGWVKGGLEKLSAANTAVSGVLTIGGRNIKTYVTGVAVAIVLVIVLIFSAFNAQSSVIRSVGTGVFSTFFGSSLMAGKTHLGTMWDGALSRGIAQKCSGSVCTFEEKSLLGKYIKTKEAKMIADMKAKGAQFTSDGNGRYSGITYDRETFKAYGDVNASAEDVARAISEKTGADPKKLEITIEGNKVTVKDLSLTSLGKGKLINGVLTETGNLGVVRGKLTVRSLKGVLNAVYHPLAKLRATADTAANSKIDATLTWAENLFKTIRGTKTSSVDVAVEKKSTDSNGKTTSTSDPVSMPDEAGSVKLLNQARAATGEFQGSGAGKVSGGAMALVGIFCIAKGIAEGHDLYSYQNVVVPAMSLTQAYMAAGDQESAIASPDHDSEGSSAFMNNFVEKKDTKTGTYDSVSNAEGIRKISGLPGGVALSDSTAASIPDKAKGSTWYSAVFNNVAANFACGEAASGAMLVTGLVLSISSPVGLIATLGGLAFGGAIIDGIAKATSGNPLDIANLPMSDKGNIIASAIGGGNYARYASFVNGGDPVSNDQYNTYRTLFAQAETSTFEQRSLAYKLLNGGDRLSLYSKLALSSSASGTANVASLTRNFTNVGSALSSTVSKLLSPKTYAASNLAAVPNDDGRSYFNLSPAVIADDGTGAEKIFENPGKYQTALDGMKNCRGIEFKTDADGVWSSSLVDGSVYASWWAQTSDYTAKCNNIEQVDGWTELQSYRHLEVLMAAETCPDASASTTNEVYTAACNEIGYGVSSTTDPSSTTSTASSGQTINSAGWTWPIGGSHTITQPYNNYYQDPNNPNHKGYHKGIDIAGTLTTPVYAAHDGTVVKTTETDSGLGCPGAILIQATGTSVYMGYQHIKQPLQIKVGTTVKAGQQIGTLGPVPNGCGSGTHLHFSIEKTEHISWYSDNINLSVDPMKYLP